MDGVDKNGLQIQHIRNFLEAPRFPNDATIPIFLSVIAIIALISFVTNALIIHVVRVNRHMHNTTNYFIVNMACADIIATVGPPSTGVYHLYKGLEWFPGPIALFGIRFIFYINCVVMLSSVFSFVAITVDRFMAVFRPLVYKTRSTWSKYVIPVIWLVALSIPAKYAFVEIRTTNDILPSNKTYITVTMDGIYDGVVITSIGYVFPHVVILFLYILIAYKLSTRRIPGNGQDAQRYQQVHQMARKAIRMMICMMIAFNACWLPVYFVFYCYYYIPVMYELHSPLTFPIVTIIIMCNGPINIIIYVVFWKNFRLAFKTILHSATNKVIGLKSRIFRRFGPSVNPGTTA